MGETRDKRRSSIFYTGGAAFARRKRLQHETAENEPPL